MIKINIPNETSQLKAVILGIGESLGGIPTLSEAYDPKSREHILAGTFPTEGSVLGEIEAFAAILKKYEVQVYRPKNIKECNQVFSRDIGFVIDGKCIVPNILEKRSKETEGIKHIFEQVDPDSVVFAPINTRMEGGDVMPWNEYLFVGYSKKEDFQKYEVSRTNEAGINFLQKTFPNRKVKAFELKKSDTRAKDNALHLDCCFQPIGKNQAIIYKGGFKNELDYEFLVSYFGKENIIEITRDEMYEMNSNVFSISPDVIVSEKSFIRLNTELRKRGFKVEEIKYSETSKMEGLLRCSTLPLLRE